MAEAKPVGWPGVVHREGRTLTRVSSVPDSESKGPAAKSKDSEIGRASCRERV